MKKITAIACVAMLLGLSACQSAPDQSKETEKQNGTVEVKNDAAPQGTVEVENANPEPSATTVKTSPADDEKNMEEAVKNADMAGCEKISNQAKKEECTAKVLAELNEKQKQSALDEKNADNQLYADAVKEASVETCGKIKNDTLKEACNYDVISGRALKEKNKQICKELENENDQINCENLLEK